MMFLCEAAIIGFIGGIIGILLSFAASIILGIFGISTIMSAELVLGGLIFSVIVGIVAGISPAKNAATIPSIEALRYE